MSSEKQYSEIVCRIRLLRAKILIKVVNESLKEAFLNVLNKIGKDADLLHSEGKLLDSISDRLEMLENEEVFKH